MLIYSKALLVSYSGLNRVEQYKCPKEGLGDFLSFA